MQARALLGGFEPILAAAVHAWLQQKFPDYFPDDPYPTETIYEATLYALAWKQAAPIVGPPRPVLPPSPSALAPPGPVSDLPTMVYTFPFTSQLSVSRQPNYSITAHSPTLQHSVPFVQLPHNISAPYTLALASYGPIPSTELTGHVFLNTPDLIQAEAPNLTSAALDALTEAIAAMKSGLEYVLYSQETAKPPV